MKERKQYVQINNYMRADAIQTELNEILESGIFNKNTAIFFTRTNCITPQDLAYLLQYFVIRMDWDFDSNNVIFIPNDFVISSIEADSNWRFGKQVKS